MSRRRTWIGSLFMRDREAGRQALIATFRRNKGNVKASARELGLARQYLFALLWRESLWQELDEIRAQFPRRHVKDEPSPEWLERTREALKKGTNDDGLQNA